MKKIRTILQGGLRYRRLLWTIWGTSIIAFIVSVIEVARGHIGNFGPLLYGIGFLFYSAFIWGDVLVFSLLWIVLVPLLLRLKSPYYLLLAFSGFWFIRASGEVIYSFLQQFTPAIRPYAAYLPRGILANSYGPLAFPKYWVVEQGFFQSVALVSFIGIVYAVCKLIVSDIKTLRSRIE